MIKIRKMMPRDVERVYQYGKEENRFSIGQNLPSFWSKEQLTRWARSKDDILLVAEENRNIVGYVLTQFHTYTSKAVVENLYVAPDYRKRGVGIALIQECTRQLKKKGATICALVEPDNKPIINLLKEDNFHIGKDFVWMTQIN